MGKAKLESYFNQKQSNGENLFVPYIMAGDGGLDVLNERILFLQNCGAAAIEIGIPFSDPVADGPTIQAAGLRALENGTTIANVLQVLQISKEERNVPIILMTYINPIYRYGIASFAQDCAEAGVDGVIVPDIPIEEEKFIADAFYESSLAFIRLAALTSKEDRLKEIAKRSEGFLYAVSVTGTTGAREAYVEEVRAYLEMLKSYSSVPVLAGFGVSTAEQAQTLSSYCDGVIVGSTIVDLFHRGDIEGIQQLIVDSIHPVTIRN
ncbi:tryptophan synthase subunit alpha [Oceanobacillus manasiensis]|uniref:tryptophan synthase subunit alpha n=1 Tax=Oceanobacillus manasiensis TaxID=586413 RepID=UPI0005AA45D4|nr:tryptophan synthase subunit alpha [Oceanobacillus manasiensis]